MQKFCFLEQVVPAGRNFVFILTPDVTNVLFDNPKRTYHFGPSALSTYQGNHVTFDTHFTGIFLKTVKNPISTFQ